MAKDLMTALREDRKSETGSDLFRSIIFMVLAAGVLWFALKKKINITVAAITLTVLCLIDLMGVYTLYLNSTDFMDKEEVSNVIKF